MTARADTQQQRHRSHHRARAKGSLQPASALTLSLIRRLQPSAVLQLDCADGALAIQIQQMLHRPIHALDTRAWLVQLARTQGVCAGIGDATALPFHDDTFDCVIVTLSAYPPGPLDDVIYEAARILRAGGALISPATPTPPRNKPGDSDTPVGPAENANHASPLLKHFSTVDRHDSPGNHASVLLATR